MAISLDISRFEREKGVLSTAKRHMKALKVTEDGDITSIDIECIFSGHLPEMSIPLMIMIGLAQSYFLYLLVSNPSSRLLHQFPPHELRNQQDHRLQLMSIATTRCICSEF